MKNLLEEYKRFTDGQLEEQAQIAYEKACDAMAERDTIYEELEWRRFYRLSPEEQEAKRAIWREQAKLIPKRVRDLFPIIPTGDGVIEYKMEADRSE
jgi:hypothetical protein